jgi:hypothetical protein
MRRTDTWSEIETRSMGRCFAGKRGRSRSRTFLPHRNRRECMEHMIVLGAGHLRRILSSYAVYYNRARTHLSLSKDAPEGRIVSGRARAW